MNFELYKKIINELSQNNYAGNVGFYVNNEPLLVKDLKIILSMPLKTCPNRI